MKDVRKYYKICSTCKFWEGERIVDTSTNSVMTDCYSHGKCALHVACKEKRAMDTCIKWQKVDCATCNDNEQ